MNTVFWKCTLLSYINKCQTWIYVYFDVQKPILHRWLRKITSVFISVFPTLNRNKLIKQVRHIMFRLQRSNQAASENSCGGGLWLHRFRQTPSKLKLALQLKLGLSGHEFWKFSTLHIVPHKCAAYQLKQLKAQHFFSAQVTVFSIYLNKVSLSDSASR